MYFNVSAVAKLLGVTNATIYKEIHAKRLGAIRLGVAGSKRPAFRVPEESLRAWEALLLEEQK